MANMRVWYANFGGRIVGEKRTDAPSSYMRDELGSTSALWDSAQAVTDSWTYWPWGEVAARSGTNPTPLQVLGTLGAYSDSGSRCYVRRRVLGIPRGQWTSLDALWPAELPHSYASCSPTSMADATGYFAWWNVVTACGFSLGKSIIGSLTGGGSVNFCSFGPSCASAVATAASLAIFSETGPLDLCIAGAIGGLVGSMVDSACSPPSPPGCGDNQNQTACNLLNALTSALNGCLGGFGFGGFTNLEDRIVTLLSTSGFGVLNSQAIAGCRGQQGPIDKTINRLAPL